MFLNNYYAYYGVNNYFEAKIGSFYILEKTIENR